MRPVFQAGDRLRVIPLEIGELQPGDVVVFLKHGICKQDAERVVHRVVKTLPQGLVTRGDTLCNTDPGVVSPDRLVGKVVARERNGGEFHPVLGGIPGLLLARGLQAVFRTRALVARLLQRPYGSLKRSGLVKRIWHPRIRVVHLSTPEGPLVKYMAGKKTVGRWWLNEDRFACRKPWDLVIRHPAKLE